MTEAGPLTRRREEAQTTSSLRGGTIYPVITRRYDAVISLAGAPWQEIASVAGLLRNDGVFMTEAGPLTRRREEAQTTSSLRGGTTR